MEISWYGLSCFRITERKLATIVTDPFAPTIGLGDVKLKGEVVTISHDADGHNFVRAVAGVEHVLSGPGEYEIGGVFITAIPTPSKSGEFNNAVYVFDYDGFTVAHLGDIGSVPSQKQIEDLELVNVLLVPVGGGTSLNASGAAELVSMIEPNIVVPMHYATPGLKIKLDDVDRFLKEMGVTDPKEEASLKINSASDLPEQSEVVLLTPRS